MERVYVYTDGGSRGNPGPAGAGVYIANERGVIKEVAEFLGNATNNYAEYSAVLIALQCLEGLYKKKTKELQFILKMDSQLIERQLNNAYQVKKVELVPLFMAIHNMRVAHFPHLTILHVPREENKEADRLANKAMDLAKGA